MGEFEDHLLQAAAEKSYEELLYYVCKLWRAADDLTSIITYYGAEIDGIDDIFRYRDALIDVLEEL